MTDKDIPVDIAREVDRQIAAVKRACVNLLTEDELRRKIARSLQSGKPLRIKLGVDPTGNELHLGFTLPLTKLRIFADLGHQPVLIIGDATAMVGDPTGRNAARPQLTREQVDGYAKNYLEQAGMILDLDKVEVRRNSEWLHAMDFPAVVKLAAQATVAQLLTREDFSKRFGEGTPIYLHELVYPLMQGWDSVIVRADVELGGQDQLFNLTMGRDLQVSNGQEPQVCMMGPLLVGLDGTRKMSKSFGNYIGICESPTEMFGKTMSIPDALMRNWFEWVTFEPLDEIDAAIAAGAHPRELKDRLARAVVTRFHDAAAADAASLAFRRMFTDREAPEDMPIFKVPAVEMGESGIWIVKLLVLAGLASTNGEARRLVRDGGVRVNDAPVSDEKATLEVKCGDVVKVGKRRYVRLERD